MFYNILIGLGVVIAIFLVVVASRPSAFKIVRAAAMSVSPALVFPHVNDLHLWTAWSPWEKLDPAMKKTYEGAPSGTGASYAWVGNSKAGEGRITITDSRPAEFIGMRLEFIKPFPCTNAVEFTFQSQGTGTLVTWTMTGTYNFMAKAVGMFMNMDKMVGGDFERGLAQLKALVESAPQA